MQEQGFSVSVFTTCVPCLHTDLVSLCMKIQSTDTWRCLGFLLLRAEKNSSKSTSFCRPRPLLHSSGQMVSVLILFLGRCTVVRPPFSCYGSSVKQTALDQYLSRFTLILFSFNVQAHAIAFGYPACTLFKPEDE